MASTEEREQKSSEGKQGVGGCVALHFFSISLALYGYMAPALQPLCRASGACRQGDAC